jgi:hypothetical protein
MNREDIRIGQLLQVRYDPPNHQFWMSLALGNTRGRRGHVDTIINGAVHLMMSGGYTYTYHADQLQLPEAHVSPELKETVVIKGVITNG